MSQFTRKVLLPVHLWGGLVLGLLLIVMAVTGALLVWRGPLERYLDPVKFTVVPGPTRLQPEDLVTRARRQHPTGEVESIRYYGEATAPFLVYFTNKDYVHLNPYTGEVLGTRPRYGVSLGWVEGMHKFLQLEPTIGEPITGYTALAFGVILISGVILWWPATRRALRAGLTINPKLKGRPWNLNLHKAVGAYAALVLLVSVGTGVPISLDWAKNLLYTLTGTVKYQPPIMPPPSGKFVGFDVIAREVATRMPQARETYIPMPKAGVVAAYAIQAGAAHPNARSYVWFQPATAQVLRFTPYEQAPLGFRLYYWGMSLHTGVLGGPIVQVLLLLGALSVPLLAYTGTASYLRKKSGAATRAAAGRPVMPTSPPAIAAVERAPLRTE